MKLLKSFLFWIKELIKPRQADHYFNHREFERLKRENLERYRQHYPFYFY